MRKLHGFMTVLALMLCASSGAAQTATPRPFTPEELEQIVSPIALYSDSVVAQILRASTYPLEVIQAARFAKANPGLKGNALGKELQKHPWDASVKALVSAPEVLEKMDSQLEWMQKLGDAFVAQQKETMDAIRRVRATAQQPPQSYWYYCPSARAYYPTVRTCPEEWIKVPPRK
jgi:hypothetical protein